MRRTILVMAIAAMAIAAGCGEKDYSDKVIARIDTREITVGDFEWVSETIEEKYLPETNDLEGKKSLLKHMINKEVMGLKASAMGYEKEEWFINLWDRYKGPFLIAQLMDQMVVKKVEVTDAEVDEYFNQMHYEYSLSQIVTTSEDDIAQIRERALAGEDFAELARNYSLGVAAQQGGYVGSNPIGRMHWWVEEELFNMEGGEVSAPLRTTTGWAIIKVHKKRKVEPVETREWAARRVKAVKEKKGMETLKAQVEMDIGLQFFPDAVNIAYDGLPDDIPLEDVVEYRITRENAPRLSIPARFSDMLICQYSDGSYTLADFEEFYYRMGLPERPTKKHGREYVVQTMHKIVFDKVLPVYAEQTAKLLEVPEVKEKLDSQKEMFLVHNLYKDQIEDEVTVTERDVEAYYAENLDMLIKQEMRDFSVALVADPATATEVYREATEGKNFLKLIKKHATDESASENDGRTGLHVRGDMADYDEIGFMLDGVGSISDPFNTSRGWAVIKVEEIENERMPTLEEARGLIRKTLLEIRYEEHLNMKIAKWSEDISIDIDESVLAKAELKRTRL